MASVLLAGLSEELVVWLEKQLRGIHVQPAWNGDQALSLLSQSDWSLVILDQSLTAPRADQVLHQARLSPGLDKVPVLYCVEIGWTTGLLQKLVDELEVRQLLFHPLDRDELAREAKAILGLKTPPSPAGPDHRVQLRAGMARLWDRNRSTIMSRLGVIQQAAVDLLDGELDEDGRRQAQGEAHKLAGTLGTYGFSQGSYLARELEQSGLSAEYLGHDQAQRVAHLVKALREELDRHERGPYIGAAGGPDTPRLLVVDAEPGFARQTEMEAIAQGMRFELVMSVAAARDSIAQERPDVVVLDLSGPSGTPDGPALMEELRDCSPPVPVLAITSGEALIDRVQVARLGGRGFLQKPVSSAVLMREVSRVLEEERSTCASVMVVDDDPVVLAMVTDLLRPKGFRVTTVQNPLHFWDALLEAAPDILVLDIEMPHVSGIELCRVVRSDPRWAAIPVLFLSGHTDADTVHRVFAARADDFVSKPIVGPELTTRITSRLERTQLLRSQTETDPLTGVVNDLKSGERLERLFAVADSHARPVCLAVLDIDNLKQIDSSLGHPTGAWAMRQMGQLLRRAFRGDDVVGRWTGGEFVIGMYGMTRTDGVERLAEVLETVRREQFSGPADMRFNVTFSAGVAQYPEDGHELQKLYLAADGALDSARFAGGNRVLPVGWRPDLAQAMRAADVVLVDDDEALSAGIIEALETRGYVVQWLSDAETALERLRGPRPDLTAKVVLLSLDARSGGGLDAFNRLAQGGLLEVAPVIVLSSGSDGSEISAARSMGAFDGVSRPLDISALMRRIRRALKAQPRANGHHQESVGVRPPAQSLHRTTWS